MVKKIADKKTRAKLGRPAPTWLVDLSPGFYYTEDLVRLSSSTSENVLRVMKRHGASKKYEIRNGKTFTIYVWKGFKK